MLDEALGDKAAENVEWRPESNGDYVTAFRRSGNFDYSVTFTRESGIYIPVRIKRVQDPQFADRTKITYQTLIIGGKTYFFPKLITVTKEELKPGDRFVTYGREQFVVDEVKEVSEEEMAKWMSLENEPSLSSAKLRKLSLALGR